VSPSAGGVGPVTTKIFPLGGDGSSFRLRDGSRADGFVLAYETYGSLNAGRDNAVLLFHAMTGSQHAAGWNEDNPAAGGLWNEECHLGWWEEFIGPGRALDTDKWFVVCANYLGGCYGSSGPTSINPATSRAFGPEFPRVEIPDIVDSQWLLLEHLGITKLRAAVGASIGGLMVLDLATRFPERLELAVPIASGSAVTPLQRLLNFEQILAIEGDADFANGYYRGGRAPDRGLSLARMIAHKTFISLAALDRRARREVRQPGEKFGTYQLVSPHESYLLHQGRKFLARFDANSYLRIVEAWQRFDLCQSAGFPNLLTALQNCRDVPFLLFTISSDVCFYPEEQEHLEVQLRLAGGKVSRVSVLSDKGHDSFLLEPRLYENELRTALENPGLVGNPSFPETSS
jgi:homoserine O-acetyltransferase/O-succinyltransferase